MYYKGEGVPVGYEYPMPETRAGSSVEEPKQVQLISKQSIQRLREAAQKEAKVACAAG